MTTFLQLGTFYVAWKRIVFFEILSADMLHIWVDHPIHQRINVFKQSADTKEDKVEVELSAPYFIQAKLTQDNFNKVRKALLTKVRGC